MDLIRILNDQKTELEELSKKKKIITREAENHHKELLKSKLIKVVTGIRRGGKSILIYSLLKDKRFAYVNFDDERLIGIEPDNLLESFYGIYGADFKYIFLDEVQNLEKWELFVNRLYRQGYNILVTGSNAKLLSKELATHLTGRHLTIELFPFSFREYLKAVNFENNISTTKGIGIIKTKLKDYIKLGGFPEVIVDKENPGRYLRELYRRIVDRDIVDRHDINYKKTFNEISLTLISNPARGVSYNRIKNQFKLGSEHTVKNYLSYLEEAYIIFLLSRFSYKPIEIEKSEKKVYVIDNGIINNISIKATDDLGYIYENTVAVELLRQKSFNPYLEIYYWKDIQHKEVDFVLRDRLKVRQLIQVCYNIDDGNTKTREIESLLKASKELNCKNLLIITENYDSTEKIKNCEVRFLPLWRWLVNLDQLMF